MLAGRLRWLAGLLAGLAALGRLRWLAGWAGCAGWLACWLGWSRCSRWLAARDAFEPFCAHLGPGACSRGYSWALWAHLAILSMETNFSHSSEKGQLNHPLKGGLLNYPDSGGPFNHHAIVINI